MYENIINTMLPAINKNGINAPDYQTILNGWKTIFRDIYGEDIYIESDSKDGVFLSLIAYVVHGCNNAIIASYNSFSPATAVGEGLSRNVKINGITRKNPSNSTVDVLITGRAGTIIRNASIRDDIGNTWSLPDEVTIDMHGQATVTAVCQKTGAIGALPHTINQIATPTLGWQTVTNPVAATLGRGVETDAELRIRQAVSVALPSKTIMDGLIGAIANLHGVSRYLGYDNDTDETDENGIPAHSIAIVIDGGDSKEIAQTILIKKTPGIPTFGTTSEIVTDNSGNKKTINFYRPTLVPIYIEIQIKPFIGYTSDIGNNIRTEVSDYINSLYIGDGIYVTRLFVPANLCNKNGSQTYEILSVVVGKSASTLGAANIDIAFNEAPTCSPENIKIVTVLE
ncbi:MULTISPECIES: baseplate J/gp47 family protein [Photorhabdus]|uniref:Bacteriophage protein n=2 Tax=Photorhabdus asymbiotica TaxID=291112 RepID=C7BRU8_PHOAA|nr:baseplate J/gp47 family protein [Photorhabdus asymbiotica]RKS66408.1 putative phage protein gp47/JayE [Photorhabdus asymbiotica]CAQ83668.1 putative bacteriophage protein [Photorhabdus asymbiotica]